MLNKLFGKIITVCETVIHLLKLSVSFKKIVKKATGLLEAIND